MGKGKWKAFTYQFTNVVIFLAMVLTIIGLCNDVMNIHSWENPTFLGYYLIVFLIFVFSLFYNQAMLQQLFYKKMEPLYTRTIYEHILHITRGHYITYLHCLLYLGMFQQTETLLKEWKPRRMQKIYKAYFEGLLAYYQEDAQGIQEAISYLQIPGKISYPHQVVFCNYLHGKLALLNKECEEAITYLQEALKESKIEVDKLAMHYDMGFALLGQDQKELAQSHFDQVKAGNPDLYFVKQAKRHTP